MLFYIDDEGDLVVKFKDCVELAIHVLEQSDPVDEEEEEKIKRIISELRRGRTIQ